MNEIIFVTHNKGKIATAKKQLQEIDFKVFEYFWIPVICNFS